MPDSRRDPKDLLFVCTDSYKTKIFTSDPARQCRKTVLAPTYYGPLNRLFPVRKGNVLAYTSHEKVVGLMLLPLDGDPKRSMGLLAHPMEVSSAAVSHDGRYLFTAGGRDCSIMQWVINPAALVSSAEDGRPPADHFADLIEGGKDGPFLKEMVDYFYYAQIRTQGEETTAKRSIAGKIPTSQVANLMRALGYYPSEREIAQMTHEIVAAHGSPNNPNLNQDTPLDFESFLRLYVNYRPVFGLSKKNIEEAFLAIGTDSMSGLIERDVLFEYLQSRGEPLNDLELEGCLRALLGDDVTKVDMLEDHLTAKSFAENLLGFEDYDDDNQQIAGQRPALQAPAAPAPGNHGH
eukprot:NODE_1411_length_1427_cov_10.405660_g1174_i0.p1 GENE.NODE_1411_length_1427_cov_10.405660_g1174_i0~~NODE_1411_length_1427_cov_10.405660_g1174_i0.p1  ORF type:complete len:358 (-),score=125.51 NODE_1411_length_1427_cov_10.405660_g1174_i0:353-1399(-)